MFQPGRICVKLAGRDARKKLVIVDVKDENTVLVDGEVRRRPCNVKHLEPLDQVVDIEKNASHEDVKNVFKSQLGIDLPEKKSKEQKERPKKQHRKKSTEK